MEKEVGGLEARRIREFNLALLEKWCWQQVTESHSLWFRLLAIWPRGGGGGGSCRLVAGRGRCGGGRWLISTMVLVQRIIDGGAHL